MTVHPKMNILSSFIHLHAVPNLYDDLLGNMKIQYFEECFNFFSPYNESQQKFHKRKSYRFGTT